MPDANSITVSLSFGSSIHNRPTVTNPTSQNNAIPATQSSLTWQLSPASDGVQITGVKFYQTAQKTTEYRPPYLTLPGGHVGSNVATWNIAFNSNSVPNGDTLWYDLEFADDDFPSLDWDPTLTISPR
jgi:hypothetical protein